MQAKTVLPGPERETKGEHAGASNGSLPPFLGGDIILFAGRRDLYGRLSRWVMRTPGESPTYAVHTAQFLDAGRYLELDYVGKIRATNDILKKHQAHDLWQRRALRYGGAGG